MSLIIFGKEESEWIQVRKQITRSGNQIANSAQFQQIYKLLKKISGIQSESINKLTNEVFSPIVSHYLMYSKKQYKQEDKQILNQFLKQSLNIFSTLEMTKPSRAIQEFIESILSPISRYYSNQDKKVSKTGFTDNFVIPMTSSLDNTVVVLRNQQQVSTQSKAAEKQEYWISDSQEETGDETSKVKDNKTYLPVFIQLIEQFLNVFQLEDFYPNHTFLFYLRLLKDLQNNKLLYKHHLILMFSHIRDIIMRKVQKITQEGLKEDSLQTLLTKDSILYGLSKNSQKTYIFSLTFLYQTKLINSINIHSKLKGITLLSDFCDELMFQHRVNEDINYYAKKLLNDKIIQKIFNFQTNQQILIKAEKFFKFMVRASCLTNENLEQILHLALKGNQNQRKIILDYIGSIITRFEFKHIQTINSVIFSIPLPQFTVQMVKLIYNSGRFLPQHNLLNTYNFFWNILTSHQKFSQLKIVCKTPVIQGFVYILQKMIELQYKSIQQVLTDLTPKQPSYIIFQILTKFVILLPQTRLHQKYKALKIQKTDAIKYLVETIQYQNNLITLIKHNPFLSSDYISFLTIMIEGYRPYSQKYLGVDILINLINQPMMFQSLLMYYKEDFEQLFNLLINIEIQNQLQFQCLKKVFVLIHKIDDNYAQNPYLLNGFNLLITSNLINSKNLEVKRVVAIFCIELIYNYYNKLNLNDKLDLQSVLIDNVLNNLKIIIKSKDQNQNQNQQQAQEQKQKQNKIISYLIFIQELLNQTQTEGIGILKSHGNLIPTKYINLIITNQTFGYISGNRDICIRINSNSSLYQLLEKIAYQFNTNPEQISLYNENGSIKNRQYSKTIEQLRLEETNLIARSIFKSQIGKSPLLETNDKFQRVLTNKAAQVFSEIFYRYAYQGFIGKKQLNNVLKTPTDDDYDYDVDSIILQFDADKDQKLSYTQFMNWTVDSSRYRQNQVRKILENLRYRPDLIKYGQKSLNHQNIVRYYLFTDQSIYPFLFDLIQSPNNQLNKISRRLLMRLATYKQSINWLNNIRTDNQFILWYQLLLIEYFLQFSSEALCRLLSKDCNVQQWREKFKKQQYKKLLNIIDSLTKQKINQQQIQSLYLSFKILSKLSFVPSLANMSQNNIFSIQTILQLDQKQLEKVINKGYKLPITPEYVESYFGLLLHYSVLVDVDQFIFHKDIQIRKISKNYIYLHRKIYGKNSNLLEKKVGQNCLEYFQIIMKQMEDQPELYEEIYPILEKTFVESNNQAILVGIIKIIDMITLLFPENLTKYPEIQSIILFKFKQIIPEGLSYTYNILSKTNLNSLISYILEYLQPLKLTDRVPQINTNSNNFVGLKNLGCICYMNAMIQQLYMTKQFTKSLAQYQGKQSKGIVYELKRLFNYLKSSNRLDYNPRDFCLAFDKDIKLHVQQDTEQFVNKMFDRLEIDCPELVDYIQKQFGGKTISVRHCPCGAIVTRQQKFFHLTVEVKDCHTLNQSLNKFITPQIIPDVYCQSCKTKKQINRSTYLKELPQTLIIHLQRMTFDLETLVRIKLHNYLQFPNEIQFKQFMYQEDNSQRYLLKGVIIHTGNPDGGHYYSLIKLNNIWYKFDDSHVSEFKVDFNKQCYGGDYDYGDFHVKSSKNAYILVYQKKKSQESFKAQQIVPQSNFNSQVSVDNTILQRQFKFYHKQFSIFLTKIISQPFISNPQSLKTNQHNYQTFTSILNLMFRYVELSTQLNQSTFNKLKQTFSILIQLNSYEYALDKFNHFLLNKQSIYKTLTESSSQYLRKIHSVILFNLIKKVFTKNRQAIIQLIQYFYQQKQYQKIQIHKASQLFQLFSELILEPSLIQLSSKLIEIGYHKIINFLISKHLDKYEKYKTVRIKIILLEIVVIAILRINDKQSNFKIEGYQQEIKQPSFYKKIIQDDVKIVERLTLIACSLCFDDEKNTQKLLPGFLSFSPEHYFVSIPYFLSIKDDLMQKRVQIIFGVPQRMMLHSNPFDFSLKSNNIYANVLLYMAYSNQYKSVLQTICQSTSYPNKQTTTVIELLLLSMLKFEDVFSYIIMLSPPNYKYGNLLDVIYEYLIKMNQIKDRKYEVIRSLYSRVQQRVQTDMKQLFQSQQVKNDIELDSVFPFWIYGRTTKIRNLQPLVLQEGDDKITIQQYILETYRMKSQPTSDQNLCFRDSIENKQSSLHKYFIYQNKQVLKQTQIHQNEDQNQFNDIQPVIAESLLILKCLSTTSFKLSLTSSSINVKFLISHQSQYINFPYELVYDLNIGIEIAKSNKFNSLNNKLVQIKGKNIEAEKHEQFKQQPANLQNIQGSAGNDQMVDGIICKACTYLNPFTNQKCQICEADLF